MIHFFFAILFPFPALLPIVLLIVITWMLFIRKSRHNLRADEELPFRSLAQIRDQERTLPFSGPQAEAADNQPATAYRTGYNIPISPPAAPAPRQGNNARSR